MLEGKNSAAKQTLGDFDDGIPKAAE